MKTLLAILLATSTAAAQHRPTPAPGPPKGAPSAASAAGRGRGTAPVAAAPATGSAPSPRALKYPPLHTIQAPPATAFTLPNGMKVQLLEDHDLPLVGGTALVRTGSLFDPPDRIGLAQLVGINLRTGGTAVKTGEQIDALLDNMAASIECSIGESAGTFTFSSLKEHAPVTLELFKEMLTQPGFRQDKLDLAKTRFRNAIAHRNDSGSVIARREFAGLVYGPGSPFRWRPEHATIARISRSDLRAFHQRYFFPANVTLGVWGDFHTTEMKASLEKLFADWTAQQQPPPEFAKVARVNDTPSPGVYLAEQKSLPQTFFTVGLPGGRRSDKDCAALEILAAILAGESQGRIPERLHTRLGVSNDVTAVWNAGYAYPGLFEISGSTRSVATVDTLKAVYEELERVRTAEVAEEELRLARDAAVRNLAFAGDTRARLFNQQLLLDYYGYPKDYLPQYQKALEAVTRADILRVARQFLKAGALTTVVAANPTLFAEPLERLGPVTKLDLAIPEAKSEPVPATDAGLAEGKRILLLAQEAVGGTAKLAAVKDYTMLADYLIAPGVRNIGGWKIVQTDRWAAPTAFRQDAIIPAGRVSAYTDGKVGFITTSQGWGPLAGPQRAQMYGDLFRSYYRILLSDRIEGRTVVATDESSVQISDTSGQVTTVEFDPQTHLPKRATYNSEQAAGAPLYSEDVYEDFRDVDGIKVPFRITINQGGTKFSDVVVREYKINTGLSPQELARRSQ